MFGIALYAHAPLQLHMFVLILNLENLIWKAAIIFSANHIQLAKHPLSSENLQEKLNCFILRMLGWLSLDSIYYCVVVGNLTAFDINFIDETVKIRMKHFYNKIFFRNDFITFSQYYFLSFTVFSMNLGFTVFQEDLLSAIKVFTRSLHYVKYRDFT